MQASEEQATTSITVTAPCTSANLGPGFDVFGLALDAFHDVVEVQVSPEERVEVEATGLDSEKIPTDPNLNSAGLVAKLLLNRFQEGIGVRIHVDKGIPVGKGLGSSAASAAATIVGLNHLQNWGLTQNEIVEIAAQGEIASAGTPHADNVGAAILGGFAFVQSYSPFAVMGLDLPAELEVAVAIPEVPMPRNKTESARAILPDLVPIGGIAKNVGGAASIVAGILSDNIALIGKGMVDAVVEPARARLIPGYVDVKQAALEAGAEGVAISGAGPSMIAVVDSSKVSGASIAKAMSSAFESAGLQCEGVAARPAQGVTVLQE